MLLLSFFAGILTVAAPCILPLLPIIIGGSITSTGKKEWWRPVIITGSLAISVILFTLLLKATTSLLGVPQAVWNIISGAIVLVFGISFVAPKAWEWISLKTGLYTGSNKLMQKSDQSHKGVGRDILLGAALGPIFSSCSPTYLLIVAVILPASFLEGFGYLLAYALGLATILLLIALAGSALVKKLGWLSNPSGVFRKVIGILFILVGIAVMTGFDKTVQTYILDQGWYDPIMRIEQQFRQ